MMFKFQFPSMSLFCPSLFEPMCVCVSMCVWMFLYLLHTPHKDGINSHVYILKEYKRRD